MSNICLPEGWMVANLGSFMDFKNGVNADKEAYGKGVKFVNVMDIFRNNCLYSHDITGSVEVTSKQLEEYSVVKGDVLFNRTSETPEEIAFSSIYLDDEKITFGGFVIRGRQNKKLLLPEYARYCFKTDIIRKEMIRRSQGAVRANIGQKDLSKVPIIIPPIEDQKRIASILDEWGKMINKTEALIEAKERQFKWLQKSTLDDDFKSYDSHLCEYATIMKQQKIEEVGDLKPLTVKLHCKGIEANERDMQITLSKKGRPYFQRFAGEFLVGRQSFHNGGFGIVPERLDGFIASSAITTLEIDTAKLDPKYLFYFFSRKDYYLRIGHIMDGTCQKELSDKQIMKLPVSIPSIEKQKEVIALLDTAQQEITLLKKLADQYRTQKRGLMQKLLSGEWHIKNKEAA